MILLSLLICLRSIVAPIRYISRTLNQGDLSVRIQIKGKDEIDDISRQINENKKVADVLNEEAEHFA